MRELLAQIYEVGGYIPFLNLQYIYCWIISLFGQVCATNPATLPTVDVPTVDEVGSALDTTLDGTLDLAGQAASQVGAQGGGGGFWSWLWPFGNGGASSGAGGASGAADVGFWASLAEAVPDPIISFFTTIGQVLGFVWDAISFVSFTLSGLLFIALMIAIGGILLIRFQEWHSLGTLPPRAQHAERGWRRWQALLDEAMSTEPKRWRQGILAADEMLGELLTRIGYYGEATQEQLRAVPEGAFVTLPQAWEAHRIRNFVAQRSSNFILTQREAFRVMKLYEQVFEEFDFI